MDILIPVADHSTRSFSDLRYTLRSVHKYLKGFSRIFIIGKLPDFIRESDTLIHIPHKDNMRYCKEKRIMLKVQFACEESEISEEFLFMNDDYFFINDLNVPKIDYYCEQRLSNRILRRGRFDDYTISLVNTLNVLVLAGFETFHFDIHYPIIYNKKQFPIVMKNYNWELKLGYVVKSLYCNTLKIEGKYKKDCKLSSIHAKFNEEIKKASDLFSTGNIVPSFLANYIQKLYTEKSPYEK